jgi:nucleotide-binding universal stress UspA family protein
MSDGLRPRRILAVMDGGEAQPALAAAAALAERHGAALDVMACVEPPADLGVLARLAGQDGPGLRAQLRERTARHARARLAALLPRHGAPPHVAVGKTFVEIVAHVVATGCDFVVKAAEPLTGLNAAFFASTDQHLLRKCPCPVWLLTEGAARAPARVIAAVDVDDWDAEEPATLAALNRRVIAAARAVMDGGGTLMALHAWSSAGDGMVWAFSSDADPRARADAYVDATLSARHAAMGRLIDAVGAPAPTPRLVRGSPEAVIAAEARQWDADLVVMGTVARTGIAGIFIGNTAENVINGLDRPVLAVKPEGFVSPLAGR